MALAGFTIGEAEGLRRAMSRKRSQEALEAFRERFVEGAARKGVDEETADTVYDKLVGFSGFGFPKSHAAAFGLLAYQSAWLRHHYPAEFLCALLNAQPMGFYPPATLVRDAQRRGVEVRPPDVNLSEARLRRSRTSAVPRSGSSYVTSVGEDDAEALVAEREANGPFRDVGDLARRAQLVARRARGARPRRRLRRLRRPRRDLLWELGLVAAAADGAGHARRGEAARARRSSRRPRRPTLPRPDALGADARRLPRRRASRSASHPLDAAAPAPARRRRSRAPSCTRRRTAPRSPSPGMAVARQRPVDRERASSSCCSRTSTAR